MQSTSEQIPARTWIAVMGVLLGAFMAVLDIQITNASLKDIQGTLSASVDEISWVSTAYLVAEIIVIPLTGWLSRVFSTRYYLVVNSALFICFSVLSGLSRTLTMMIVCRALQGFTGGVLIPMAFTVILNHLPKSKQPVGLALFGLTATFAPSVGPLIGGWLTDNYGWPSIFYINIIPGVLLITAIWFALDQEPLHLNQLKGGDWWGVITIAIGLGAMQIVLEEGNRKDWFGSPFIVRLTIIAVVFLLAFLVIEFVRRDPLVNLRLFGRRNFGLGSIVNIVLGMGLYGCTYILPVYLGQIQGYDAFQIGKTVMWMGLPQLFIIPLVPRLMKHIDSRMLIGFGVVMFGSSCLMMTHMSALNGYDQFRWPQVVRALGQPFIIIPLSAVATAGIAAGKESGSASALFNMMRNIGGSIAIAALATILTNREHLHSARIGESVSLFDFRTQQRLVEATNRFMGGGADAWTAGWQSIQVLDRIVRREAFVMAFNDCFYLMGLALLLSGIVVPFFRRAKLAGGGPVH
ncbi:MAG TPA: DHA2 family efflux MFS transporter permease subunit [Bryobacteraceae bacterium]|jgi:DHA2 family multidrug resistance protein|nr:DHA2 family efflux MFS transporter permease subunit [Bryobacteraceae bacterium]